MTAFSQIALNQKWVASAHFTRKSSRLARLYDRLATGVFPLLASAGFQHIDLVPRGFGAWTGDNRIVFQRRDREEWPTIEFELDPTGAGSCKVHLGVLPPECWSLSGERVPQDEAAVWMSPAYLLLTRNARGDLHSHIFGARRLFFLDWPSARADVITLRRLLQVAFQHFKDGFPARWRKAKHYAVHRNLILMWGPWNLGRVNRSVPAGDYYKALL
jgi:hypothetical protein